MTHPSVAAAMLRCLTPSKNHQHLRPCCIFALNPILLNVLAVAVAGAGSCSRGPACSNTSGSEFLVAVVLVVKYFGVLVGLPEQ